MLIANGSTNVPSTIKAKWKSSSGSTLVVPDRRILSQSVRVKYSTLAPASTSCLLISARKNSIANSLSNPFPMNPAIRDSAKSATKVPPNAPANREAETTRGSPAIVWADSCIGIAKLIITTTNDKIAPAHQRCLFVRRQEMQMNTFSANSYL